MRIAVYPGSFNPLHIGHLAIMQYLTKERDYFDWVYLVISPKNPIKNIAPATAMDRYKDAVEAVKRHPDLHVWVEDIEIHMPPPQYTINTLDALKRREPENEFKLVIGADNLENIHRWRNFQRILTEYGVVVYPRKGYDLATMKKQLTEECKHLPVPYVLDESEITAEGMRSLEETLQRTYNIRIIDAPIVNISSTEIRMGQAAGRDMSEWLM